MIATTGNVQNRISSPSVVASSGPSSRFRSVGRRSGNPLAAKVADRQPTVNTSATLVAVTSPQEGIRFSAITRTQPRPAFWTRH